MGRHRKPDELDDHATTPTSSVPTATAVAPLPEPEASPGRAGAPTAARWPGPIWVSRSS
ncbi:hypothetical protein GS426_01910 [Rhodococcus hoagii]|nr:hypothetical protein [Prescottella equi]